MKTAKELLKEADIEFSISILAIAHWLHEQTGESRGVFQCPRCRVGEVFWSIAPNGHGRVKCSTLHTLADGSRVSCTNLIQ